MCGLPHKKNKTFRKVVFIMSTSCAIGRMTPNGVQALFVKSNGTRDYMEPMLSTFYTDPDKVNLLFNNGPLVDVSKEPCFDQEMQNRVKRVQSYFLLNSIKTAYDVSRSFMDIGSQPEVDVKYFGSAREFLFNGPGEYTYYYDANTRTWVTCVRDGNDRFNIDKLKMVKCEAKNVNDAQKLLYGRRLVEYARNGNYGLLKDDIESIIPVTLHYSRKPGASKYYLTFGSSRLFIARVPCDLDVPRKDTGKVIYRCDSLEELLKAAVNVLWKL